MNTSFLLPVSGLIATARAIAAMLLWAACTQISDARQEPSLDTNRLPWSPSAAPFVRSYLSLGPIPAGALAEKDFERIAQTQPEAGTTETLGNGTTEVWQSGSSWSDTLELGSIFSNSPRAADARPELALARFTVTRDSAGEVELAVGANFGFTLWVNGNPVGDFPGPEAFLPDLLRIPVALRQGNNDVLMRFEKPLTWPRFSLRAVEAGATPSPSHRIATSIDWTALPNLVIRSVARNEDLNTRIHYEVRAPGGEIVDRTESSVGDPIRFETAAWRDGPYEVACAHTDAWGNQQTALLPWYKGDPIAAARQAMKSAPTSVTESSSLVFGMLRQLIQQRLSGLEGASLVSAIEALHSPLFEWEERVRLDSAKGVSPPMYRLAWIDPADGSPQFCRAYLPLNYDPRSEWPVIIQLHGFNPANPPYTQWWSVDQRHSALVDTHGAILLEPHGRGNAQYLGLGEADVMFALNEARKRFSIDKNRVYLMGESMGGSGTWLIGSRHTDTFAAIAPVFGGWDFRVVAPNGDGPPWRAKDARQNYLLESRSSFLHLESLLATPVYALHGDADPVVLPDNTRHAVRLLQRWGYPIRYQEVPGGIHDDLGRRGEVFSWLLEHRLEGAPRSVRIRSADLRGASAHWLSIQGYEQSGRVVAADAEIIAPGVVRLDTDNASEVALRLPLNLRGESRSIAVHWNGEVFEAPIDLPTILLSKNDDESTIGYKKPGVEGPISDLIRTPFAVVFGTASANPDTRQRLRQKADAFKQLWHSWQGVAPRVLADTEIAPEQEQEYSLLLLGGPEANRVARRMAKGLPFSIDGQTVSIGDMSVHAPDAFVESIWPHPDNPDRYIVLVDATSADGFYFWNPLLWNVPFGYPSSIWDWRIVDGRLAEFSDPLDAHKAWIASGNFDGAWRTDPSTTWRGDDRLRSESPLREAPPIGGSLSESLLDARCGVYEISPWVTIQVTRSDEGLQLSIAGAPPEALIAESESRFAFASTAVPIVFDLDPSGNSVALTLYNDGVPTRAAKR